MWDSLERNHASSRGRRCEMWDFLERNLTSDAGGNCCEISLPSISHLTFPRWMWDLSFENLTSLISHPPAGCEMWDVSFSREKSHIRRGGHWLWDFSPEHLTSLMPLLDVRCPLGESHISHLTSPSWMCDFSHGYIHTFIYIYIYIYTYIFIYT